MEAALQDLDLDRFEDLLTDRAALIEKLAEYASAAAVDTNWQKVARAYDRQEQAILREVEHYREVLEKSLSDAARVSRAARTYEDGAQQNSLMHDGVSA